MMNSYATAFLFQGSGVSHCGVEQLPIDRRAKESLLVLNGGFGLCRDLVAEGPLHDLVLIYSRNRNVFC
jgi:hypothetical protein